MQHPILNLQILNLIMHLPCDFDMQWRPWILFQWKWTSWNSQSDWYLRAWEGCRWHAVWADICAWSLEWSAKISYKHTHKLCNFQAISQWETLHISISIYSRAKTISRKSTQTKTGRMYMLFKADSEIQSFQTTAIFHKHFFLVSNAKILIVLLLGSSVEKYDQSK